MAVKYHCPECPHDPNRRWVEWGAEKLGYKCPDCGGELVQIVKASSAPAPKKSALKRRKKKVVVAPPPPLSTFEDDDAPTAPVLDALTGENVDDVEVDDTVVEDAEFVEEDEEEEVEVAAVAEVVEVEVEVDEEDDDAEAEDETE